MSPSFDPELSAASTTNLQVIQQMIATEAQRRQGNCLALLDLLRVMEALHRDIRDTLFRDALPNNRQRLYNLLRDIEMNGGWPYIQRMKLQQFLQYFLEEVPLEDSSEEFPGDQTTY